ncbi:MAG: DoxX family protein [Chloroflexi bacterium]|nr:DoxX family protein [Chloroflexota bacterium]
MIRDRRLWAGQIFLAIAFLVNGGGKVAIPAAELAAMGPANLWVADASPEIVIVVGLLELLGAIGVILPWATGVRRELTFWAAAGLALTMLGAAGLHVVRGEMFLMPVNAAIGVIALLVALGRRSRTAPTD